MQQLQFTHSKSKMWQRNTEGQKSEICIETIATRAIISSLQNGTCSSSTDLQNFDLKDQFSIWCYRKQTVKDNHCNDCQSVRDTCTHTYLPNVHKVRQEIQIRGNGSCWVVRCGLVEKDDLKLKVLRLRLKDSRDRELLTGSGMLLQTSSQATDKLRKRWVFI